VLKAEELPTGVTDLDTSLTDVDGNNFSHDEDRNAETNALLFWQ
jgi:hypothetical protein